MDILKKLQKGSQKKIKGLFNPLSPVGQKPSPSEPGYILSLQIV